MFTPEQVEQLMGLPVGYTSSVSKTQRFRLIGNGWSIPVIEHFFRPLRAYYPVFY
jgi:site-specific DNA-cytosine methylase